MITRNRKSLAVGILGVAVCTALIYNHSSRRTIRRSELVQDNKEHLPFVLQQSCCYDKKKKTTVEYSRNSGNLQRSPPFSKSSSRQKKFSADKRGWSYKGDGQYRCRVQTIGCFYPSVKNRTTSSSILKQYQSPQMTDSNCILQCSKRVKQKKFVFAGIRNGNECICGYYPRAFIAIVEGGNKCKLPCVGDESRMCGGYRGLTMVYLVKSQCKPAGPLANIVNENSVIGCYRKPNNLRAFMDEYSVIGDMVAARCLLQCEYVGLVLAIPTKTNVCYCGLTTAKFDLSRPVNMTRCSGSDRNYVIVYRSNSEDKRCEQKRFLKVGELDRKVGLISFPGSGNTWIRHLLESATGIYTGSVFGDPFLVNGGFMGELLPPEDYRIAVVKSHHQHKIRRMEYLTALMNVYRNPYDAILSEYNRRKQGHTGTIDDQSFDMEDFKGISSGSFSAKWRVTTKIVLENKLPNYVFSYEDLVGNTLSISEQMARFVMGDAISDAELRSRLLCMRLSSTGEFKRKKRTGGFDPYSRKAKLVVNNEITQLDNVLQKFGHASIAGYLRQSTDGEE